MGPTFDFTNRQLKVLAVLSATAALLSIYLLARHWIVEPGPTELPAIHAADSDRDSPRPVSDGFVGAFVIDPNTAPADSLELLPGIGPVKARRIVEYRRDHRFATVDDLLEINGIGPATLERMRPFLKVTVDE